MSVNFFNQFFHDAPDSVNVGKIWEDWNSLAPPYDVGGWILPLPVWATRDFDFSGDEIWRILKANMGVVVSDNPICIYVHSPFCSSKCGFCDSYSFKLESHKNDHIRQYVDILCFELSLWADLRNIQQRPVSTVHLGGGTPAFLGETAIKKLIEFIKGHFNVGPETELALESTVESLTDEMIGTLNELGFRRLHVGVQSLEGDVRKLIGRRTKSSMVTECIRKVQTLDWIVSVDLVCGLPSQSLKGFIAGIEELIGMGVNGFSIYELLIYAQNRKWADAHQLTKRDHLSNYFMFQAGVNLLLQSGFSSNHFNHWADERDQNIYFTAPSRNEDCLAVGTIADGVFGDLHYRHPRYAPYMKLCKVENPGLVGGLQRTQRESALYPFISALHSGYIDPEISPYFDQLSRDWKTNLLERWQKMNLIKPDVKGGFVLMPNGSWFTGNMVQELVAPHRPDELNGLGII